MRSARLLLAAALPLLACTPTVIVPQGEQSRAERELEGQQRYLRVAAFAGPLWGDTEKVFLSELPPAEVDLVETPAGAPITPPKAERVLAPGTPVRVKQVEFPTSWIMAQRVITTPRFHPWVYLDVPGDRRPYVVVLSQVVKSAEDVRGELERILTADDPRPAFAALDPAVRDAIMRKEAREGMSSRALEMAWGVPERKRLDRPASTEEWIWPGKARRAYLRDDRVERLEQ